MKLKGKIKFVNYKSRFGFIILEEGGKEVYFSTTRAAKDLSENDSVEFELEDASKGPKAINVNKSDR